MVPSTALQIKGGFHGSDSWFFTLAECTLTFKVSSCMRRMGPEALFISFTFWKVLD